MEQLATDLSVQRLVKTHGGTTVRAYCDVAFDNALLIKGLRIVEGKHGLFVSMPRQQGKDAKWYDSVVALSKDVKQAIDRAVLEAYHSQTPQG